MSSSNETTPRSQISTLWSSWIVPPVAAGAAIVPTYYGFAVKTAQQLQKPIPTMSALEVLMGGLRLAPTVAGLVGTQMVLQNASERKIKRLFGNPEDKAATLVETAASSLLVGAMSAPGIAIFNGQAAKQSPLTSLRNLTVKQAGAISAQETAFVMGMSAGGHVYAFAKKHFGDNEAMKYGSSFITGALGSLCGHPANTALTLWQNGLKVENIFQLARGGPAKAIATGVFSMGFQLAKEHLNNLGQKH